MDESRFWALIALIDDGALDDGDEEAALKPLVSALTVLDVAQIEAFDDHLAQALFAIDGEEYADNAGDSGRSDDGFLYLRCYVVARGQDYYSQVKADPAKTPDSIDQWCEPLLYAARNAWGLKTGRDPNEWSFDASVSYESGSNDALWGSSR